MRTRHHRPHHMRPPQPPLNNNPSRRPRDAPTSGALVIPRKGNDMQQPTCPICDGPMPPRNQRPGSPRKYCSTQCSRRAHRDNTTRTCQVDACARPVRAKGYCASHYNKLVMPPHKRHAKAAVPCSVCGATVLRRPSTTRQPTCSVACRTVVQWGETLAPTGHYDWNHAATSRARNLGATTIHQFDREQVFERDDWTCQICQIRCSSPNPYERTSATVDHIIPLSAGGQHTMANAQTSCLSCNCRKQDDLGPIRAA